MEQDSQMAAVKELINSTKAVRQARMRDQDRDRAFVKATVYGTQLEAAKRQQSKAAQEEQRILAEEELCRLSDVCERRLSAVGQAHLAAQAYTSMREKEALEEQQRAELRAEAQAKRFKEAMSRVQAEKDASKVPVLQHQQRRAEILAAERRRAHAFALEQQEFTQASKRRQLSADQLERERRRRAGMAIDFKSARMHDCTMPAPDSPQPWMEAQSAPPPMSASNPDPAQAAGEYERRLAEEKHQRAAAAIEAERRAKERYIAAQAKLKAEEHRRQVEAELAALAAARVQQRKEMVAQHRVKLQDQSRNKQQELLRIFEDNFLPHKQVAQDEHVPRPLPTFLQLCAPISAPSPAPAPASGEPTAATGTPPPQTAHLGPSAAAPAAAVVAPDWVPKWSTGRPSALGKGTLPPAPRQLQASVCEAAVQTEQEAVVPTHQQAPSEQPAQIASSDEGAGAAEGVPRPGPSRGPGLGPGVLQEPLPGSTDQAQREADDVLDAWGEEQVDRELEAMRRQLGLQGIPDDLRSSSTSLSSDLSLPSFVGDVMERRQHRQAVKEAATAAAGVQGPGLRPGRHGRKGLGPAPHPHPTMPSQGMDAAGDDVIDAVPVGDDLLASLDSSIARLLASSSTEATPLHATRAGGRLPVTPMTGLSGLTDLLASSTPTMSTAGPAPAPATTLSRPSTADATGLDDVLLMLGPIESPLVAGLPRRRRSAAAAAGAGVGQRGAVVLEGTGTAAAAGIGGAVPAGGRPVPAAAVVGVSGSLSDVSPSWSTSSSLMDLVARGILPPSIGALLAPSPRQPPPAPGAVATATQSAAAGQVAPGLPNPRSPTFSSTTSSASLSHPRPWPVGVLAVPTAPADALSLSSLSSLTTTAAAWLPTMPTALVTAPPPAPSQHPPQRPAPDRTVPFISTTSLSSAPLQPIPELLSESASDSSLSLSELLSRIHPAGGGTTAATATAAAAAPSGASRDSGWLANTTAAPSGGLGLMAGPLRVALSNLTRELVQSVQGSAGAAASPSAMSPSRRPTVPGKIVISSLPSAPAPPPLVTMPAPPPSTGTSSTSIPSFAMPIAAMHQATAPQQRGSALPTTPSSAPSPTVVAASSPSTSSTSTGLSSLLSALGGHRNGTGGSAIAPLGGLPPGALAASSSSLGSVYDAESRRLAELLAEVSSGLRQSTGAVAALGQPAAGTAGEPAPQPAQVAPSAPVANPPSPSTSQASTSLSLILETLQLPAVLRPQQQQQRSTPAVPFAAMAPPQLSVFAGPAQTPALAPPVLALSELAAVTAPAAGTGAAARPAAPLRAPAGAVASATALSSSTSDGSWLMDTAIAVANVAAAATAAAGPAATSLTVQPQAQLPSPRDSLLDVRMSESDDEHSSDLLLQQRPMLGMGIGMALPRSSVSSEQEFGTPDTQGMLSANTQSVQSSPNLQPVATSGPQGTLVTQAQPESAAIQQMTAAAPGITSTAAHTPGLGRPPTDPATAADEAWLPAAGPSPSTVPSSVAAAAPAAPTLYAPPVWASLTGAALEEALHALAAESSDLLDDQDDTDSYLLRGGSSASTLSELPLPRSAAAGAPSALPGPACMPAAPMRQAASAAAHLAASAPSVAQMGRLAIGSDLLAEADAVLYEHAQVQAAMATAEAEVETEVEATMSASSALGAVTSLAELRLPAVFSLRPEAAAAAAGPAADASAQAAGPLAELLDDLSLTSTTLSSGAWLQRASSALTQPSGVAVAPAPMAVPTSSAQAAAAPQPAALRASADSDDFEGIMSSLLKDIQQGLMAMQGAGQSVPPTAPAAAVQLQGKQAQPGTGAAVMPASCAPAAPMRGEAAAAEALNPAALHRRFLAQASQAFEELAPIESPSTWQGEEQRAQLAAEQHQQPARGDAGQQGEAIVDAAALHRQLLAQAAAAVAELAPIEPPTTWQADQEADTAVQWRTAAEAVRTEGGSDALWEFGSADAEDADGLRSLLTMPTLSLGVAEVRAASLRSSSPGTSGRVTPALLQQLQVPAPLLELRRSLDFGGAALSPGGPSVEAMRPPSGVPTGTSSIVGQAAAAALVASQDAYSFLQQPRASTVRGRAPSVNSFGHGSRTGSPPGSPSPETISPPSTVSSLESLDNGPDPAMPSFLSGGRPGSLFGSPPGSPAQGAVVHSASGSGAMGRTRSCTSSGGGAAPRPPVDAAPLWTPDPPSPSGDEGTPQTPPQTGPSSDQGAGGVSAPDGAASRQLFGLGERTGMAPLQLQIPVGEVGASEGHEGSAAPHTPVTAHGPGAAGSGWGAAMGVSPVRADWGWVSNSSSSRHGSPAMTEEQLAGLLSLTVGDLFGSSDEEADLGF